MANYYIYNGGSGAGGTSWATAYTTLATAISGKAAGDVFFVAHDHVESTAAAISTTLPGTSANPNYIYCVNRAGSVPPVAADLRDTAQISTTGTSSITLTGFIKECYGIIFSAGSAANSASIGLSSSTQKFNRYVNCTFKLNNTNTASVITLGLSTGTFTVLENCRVQFGEATTQKINCAGRAVIRNTSVPFIAGAVFPATLFNIGAASYTVIEGLDLSQLTSGTYFAMNGTVLSTFVVKDCKLNAGPAIAVSSGIQVAGVGDLILVRCDSGDTIHRTERINYMGAMATDATTYLTGGATDGTTPYSIKITTNANSTGTGFECLPIHIWNDVIGSPKTVTIQGQWAGGAVPNNNDIWFDTHYLGVSGFPQGLVASSGVVSTINPGVGYSAGLGTWVNPQATKFAMSATFTAQEKGPLTIYVKARKASSTFWFDPKPVIT